MSGDHDGSHSNPFHPGSLCCERCVFDSGKHSDWCPRRFQTPPDANIEKWRRSHAPKMEATHASGK
jgi:hypothetical protein